MTTPLRGTLLSEEHRLFQRTVREFVEREIAPHAARLDATGEFPHDNLRKMAEMGLMGLLVPPEYGGIGASALEYVLALEEVARGCASTAVILSVHNSLVCYPLWRFGTPEQRERYLRRLARGEMLGAFALTEPEAGSDAASIRTRARREGDSYVLNGTKIFITSGDVADIVLLFATLDPGLGSRGITAFLLEKGTPGLRVGKKEDKLGLRASSTVELVLEDCLVPAANRLGEEGEGFRLALQFLTGGRIGIAAQAVGIAVPHGRQP